MRKKIAATLAFLGGSLVFASFLGHLPVNTKFAAGGSGLVLFLFAYFLNDKK